MLFGSMSADDTHGVRPFALAVLTADTNACVSPAAFANAFLVSSKCKPHPVHDTLTRSFAAKMTLAFRLQPGQRYGRVNLGLPDLAFGYQR
jgi:hypothetical protein